MVLSARSLRIFAVIFFLGIVASMGVAPAAVDLSTGVRYVMDTGTLDDCSAKAQTALNKYLGGAAESATGTHEYIATGPLGATSPQTMTATGTIHCFPGTPAGYTVTFTCVVETPNNPYSADALCLDLAHNFSGKPETALATPSPEPTGCTTANLIGTWTSDDGKTTITMDSSGNLTDGDGVSGSWILYHDTATLTYYGNHTLKLSSDGKHLSGDGYNLTRKC
ncbi:MAG: hypothetical protein KGN02_06480 [bacterium]|nr:hypothetical protein [bacterium]